MHCICTNAPVFPISFNVYIFIDIFFCRLIMFSNCFEELDLEKNLIGDMAAREIMEALEHRKETG